MLKYTRAIWADMDLIFVQDHLPICIQDSLILHLDQFTLWSSSIYLTVLYLRASWTRRPEKGGDCVLIDTSL